MQTDCHGVQYMWNSVIRKYLRHSTGNRTWICLSILSDILYETHHKVLFYLRCTQLMKLRYNAGLSLSVCVKVRFALSQIFDDLYPQRRWPRSSVGIATDYGLDVPEIETRWGRDFPPVQTGPGAYPASCTMVKGSFPGVKFGRGVTLTTHPHLAPRSWKSRAIPLPPSGPQPGL